MSPSREEQQVLIDLLIEDIQEDYPTREVSEDDYENDDTVKIHASHDFKEPIVFLIERSDIHAESTIADLREAMYRATFEKQKTPDHCWVIAFDTICDGWQTGNDEDGNIPLYTKEEADAEIKDLLECFEDDDSFIVHMDEYLDGRKCFYPEGVFGDVPARQ